MTRRAAETEEGPETLAVCPIIPTIPARPTSVAAFALVHINAEGKALSHTKVLALPDRPLSAYADALIDAIRHEWLAVHPNIKTVALTTEIIGRIKPQDLPKEHLGTQVLRANLAIEAVALDMAKRWERVTVRDFDWIVQHEKTHEPLFLRPMLRHQILVESKPEIFWPLPAPLLRTAVDLSPHLPDGPFWRIDRMLPSPDHPIWTWFEKNNWEIAQQAMLMVVALALRNTKPPAGARAILCVDVPTCAKDAIERELIRRTQQQAA